MQLPQSHHELHYQYEIFRAKLEIRDHYIRTIVSDIYENTGQVLSLVRIQLSTLGTVLKDDMKVHLAASGELVGQAICDLRNMCRSFYPENEILTESGLINALKRELKVDPLDTTSNRIRVKGVPFALEPGCGLIFFLVILEITALISKALTNNSLRLQISYTNTMVKIYLDYYGDPVDLAMQQVTTNEHHPAAKLSLQQRIQLIGGELIIKNKSGKRSQIVVSMLSDQSKAA